MTKKIVLCTAGGAIASFHAAFRSMSETLRRRTSGQFELMGAVGGLSGLMAGRFVPIDHKEICPDRAGSMIGADREIAETQTIISAIKKHDIHAIIMMGGDNHLGEAAKCHKEKINIVGYPKTMDGDLSSFITLGWETAVTVGSLATRWHHHTAMTYGRVFFVGAFGRNTDWVSAGISLYGGADLCLPCEAQYDWTFVLEKIRAAYEANKKRFGRGFAVVTYSEGVRIKGVAAPPKKHCSFDKHGLPKLQPEWTGLELVRLCKRAGFDAAFQAHTYTMRDHPPTETDKRLSALAGKKCVELIMKGDFGKAVVFKPRGKFYTVDAAPLLQVATQRQLQGTGYFDYEQLKTTKAFAEDYGPLFKASLGELPEKEMLVYPNMLRKT